MQVRQLADELISALGQASHQVLQELMAEDALSRKVGQAYQGFADQASRYAGAMEIPMLQQRVRARR